MKKANHHEKLLTPLESWDQDVFFSQNYNNKIKTLQQQNQTNRPEVLFPHCYLKHDTAVSAEEQQDNTLFTNMQLNVKFLSMTRLNNLTKNHSQLKKKN